MIDCIQKVEEAMVGDLVAKVGRAAEAAGIVVAREQSEEDGFADAIIVREHNGRISRCEAWLEVLNASR